MLLFLAVVLAMAWMLAFGVYHVASAAIHLLIIAALAAVIIHFISGISRRRII
jgi:hypothetical protein